MIIFPFASSSEGNCTYIESGVTKILIDCGVSFKQIKETLGKKLKEIDAIFITHEHTDHIRGLSVLCKNYNKLPVYVDKQVTEVFDLSVIVNINYLEAGVKINLSDLEITPFSVKHDTISRFAFFIENDYTKLGYITDSGCISKLMKNFINKANALLIECDYDEQLMLDYPDYDEILKDRITSNFGHLSNQQVIEFLKENDVDKFKTIILAHLSPRTNSVEHVRELFAQKFPNKQIYIAPLENPIEI